MPWLADGYFSYDGQVDMESFTVPNNFVGFYESGPILGCSWGINGLGCRTIIKHIQDITARKSQMLFEFYNQPLPYVLNDRDLCFQIIIGSTPYALYPSKDTIGKVQVKMTLQMREGDEDYLDRRKECVEFVNELIHRLQGGNPA